MSKGTAHHTKRLYYREGERERKLGHYYLASFSKQKQRSVDSELEWRDSGLPCDFYISLSAWEVNYTKASIQGQRHFQTYLRRPPCWRTRRPRWRSPSWLSWWASRPCWRRWWRTTGRCWVPGWSGSTPPAKRPTSDSGGCVQRVSSLWRKTLRVKAVALSACQEVRKLTSKLFLMTIISTFPAVPSDIAKRLGSVFCVKFLEEHF